MSSQSPVITISNMEISLDQLLTIIRQLDEPTRVRIAKVLVETKADAELANLIEQLASTPPADDVTDAGINAEVEAVRHSDG